MKLSHPRLVGQSALVTGSSSGIGEAIARRLSDEGANVVINYAHSSEKAQRIVKDIIWNGGNAIAIQADVSKEDQVEAMFDQMISAFGTIDILVNNSGIQKDASLIDMTLEEWQQVINVNLTGQFLCSRAAVREFIRRGEVPERSQAIGKIICMSSVHEMIPWSGHINYASSKGGVSMFMKSLAQEVGGLKIRVNAIAPGAIKTNINKLVWGAKESASDVLKLIPYGRWGEAEDVAKVAAWLCCDESDYVHGTTIFVDGGMMLYPGFEDNG